MFRGPFLPVTLAGAALSLASALAAAPAEGPDKNADSVSRIVPIHQHPQADDPVFVQSRCRDFVIAVVQRRVVEISNPLTGLQPERGEATAWAVAVDLAASFPDAAPIGPGAVRFVADYARAFGYVSAEQAFLRRPIYLMDKETCTPLFQPLAAPAALDGGVTDGAAMPSRRAMEAGPPAAPVVESPLLPKSIAR